MQHHRFQHCSVCLQVTLCPSAPLLLSTSPATHGLKGNEPRRCCCLLPRYSESYISPLISLPTKGHRGNLRPAAPLGPSAFLFSLPPEERGATAFSFPLKQSRRVPAPETTAREGCIPGKRFVRSAAAARTDGSAGPTRQRSRPWKAPAGNGPPDGQPTAGAPARSVTPRRAARLRAPPLLRSTAAGGRPRRTASPISHGDLDKGLGTFAAARGTLSSAFRLAQRKLAAGTRRSRPAERGDSLPPAAPEPAEGRGNAPATPSEARSPPRRPSSGPPSLSSRSLRPSLGPYLRGGSCARCWRGWRPSPAGSPAAGRRAGGRGPTCRGG